MSYGSHPHHHSGDRSSRAPASHLDRDTPRHARQHGNEDHRGQRPRAQHAPKEQNKPAGSYTFGHGRRQVRLGPVAFWTIVGTLVIMAGWSIVTATYFAFRDDVLARLIARQAEMQFAYEDRIAEMRVQVDRVTSRQLLDQEQFEQKLEQLVRRQATLKSRAMTLGTFADPAATGSIKPDREGSTPMPPAKPAPLDAGAQPATPGRGARLEPRGLSAIVARITGRTADEGVTGTLKRLRRIHSTASSSARPQRSMPSRQNSTAAHAKFAAHSPTSVSTPAKRRPISGVGGPFVPLRMPSNASSFDKQLQRIHVTRAQVDRLNRKLVTVPVRKPVTGELDLSSGFGVRLDPFFGRPAMHTGLDFRGDIGEQVRATAAGTVSQAGWSGGYGKMVEVDHGNGLATRYGHLSEIDVNVGQTIKIGQVLGRLGSTGRSTGPHLHYETRVDGDAVDPQKFLRAGTKLGFGS